MSTKKMNRRDFLRYASQTAAGVGLAAYVPKEIEKTTYFQQEKTTVTLWHGWTGADNTEMLGKILDSYNKTNADNINIVPTAYAWDEFFAKWVLAAAAGNPADVALYHPTEIPEFAERGVIIPLDGLATSVSWSWEGIAEPVKNQCYYKSKLYGIIEDIHPMAMYYNVDLAKKAGLDPEKPPTTSAELITWGKAMTTKDSAGNFTQVGFGVPTTGTARWIWHSFLAQAGGTFLDSAGKPAFNSDAGKQALQYMYDLIYTHQVSPVGVNDGDAFQTGKEGIYFSGPWMTNSFVKAGLNFRTAPLPNCFKQPGAWVNSHVLSLSKTKDEKKQGMGMKFIKWFALNNLDACVNVGVIPVTPKVMGELKTNERWKYYEAFAKEAGYVSYEPMIPQYTQIFTFGKPTPLTVNVEAALTKQKPIAQALTEMEKGIIEILATPIS